MERKIEQARGHLIVCGYGRVGRQIAALRQDDLLTVHGDATEDETLRQAGIDRAAGLVTGVGSDADNVFVTLSARALRADLTIVACADVASGKWPVELATFTRPSSTR